MIKNTDLDRIIHKRRDNRYEIFDFDTLQRIILNYDLVREFNENLAAFNIGAELINDVLHGGLWGFIDIYGNEIIKPQYDFVYFFSHGYSQVFKGNNVGMINTNGELIIPICYDRIFYDFHSNLFSVVKDNKFGIINSKNETIIPCIYEDRNMCFVRKKIVLKLRDFVFHVYDNFGNLLLEINNYYDVGHYIDNYAIVNIGGIVGEYDSVAGGKWGFINDQGMEVIPCQFDNVRDFENGVAEVYLNNEWFCIDILGNRINQT